MKQFYIIGILLLAFTLVGCEEDDITHEYACLEGEVLGKIRTGGGGLAVALKNDINGTVTWKDHQNVVEVLNIPVEFTIEGTTIYFSAREALEGERGPITSDGDESIELVLSGTDFSDRSCGDL